MPMAKGFHSLHTSSETNRVHRKLHIDEIQVLIESIDYCATLCLRKEAVWGAQGGAQKIRVQ
jgi:hypothetical protein